MMSEQWRDGRSRGQDSRSPQRRRSSPQRDNGGRGRSNSRPRGRERSRSRGRGHGERPGRPAQDRKVITVSQALVGAVIGKGGETIKRLQSDTGVRIDVSKDDGDGDDRSITLEGPAAAIQDAEMEIDELISSFKAKGGGKGGGKADKPRSSGPQEQKVIQVPQDMVGLLIGKGGESIKKLSEESGARIEISRKDEDTGDQKNVTIKGSRDAIDKAVQMIEQTIDRAGDDDRQQQSSDDEPQGPKPPPGFVPCVMPTWLHHPELNIYFERTTGCLCWFDPASRMFAPIHKAPELPISFTGQAAVKASNISIKGSAAKHVVIPDLHKAAKAMKVNVDQIDKPAALIAVYGSPVDESGVPVEVAARSMHEKLFKRLSAYRSQWVDEAFLPALSGSLSDIAAGYGGKQPVAAVVLVAGRRVLGVATPGAHLCIMTGASAAEVVASPSSETEGMVTCYEELDSSNVNSTVSVALTVGESCLDASQMLSAAAPQLYHGRLRAANISLIRAAAKGGTSKAVAVACAGLRHASKADASTAAEPKTLKLEEVLPKVRVLQILIRHWKGTGPKPTDPVRRKPVSRSLEEAELLMLGILDILVGDNCASFTTRCKKSSECQSSLKGGDLAGDLGWLERAKDSAMKEAKGETGSVKSVVKSVVPAAVLKAAFELKVGELSDLVTSELGVHLLWRTG